MLFFQGKAQTPLLRGHIYDSQTRAPLAGVLIKTLGDQLLAESDRKGYFEIKNPAGRSNR